MAVGVAATAGKHAPIGITPHVAGLPVGFGLVVQSHGDILVGGLGIEHGFDGFVGPGGVDIHPVVLLGIVGDGVVGIAHALAVSAVTALEGVEIHPGGLAPPFGRGIATSGVIGHQVVMVDGLDTGGEGIPYLGLDVALDVAAHEPDDVGLVLVTVGEEGAVFPGLVDTQFAVLHQSAPDAYHADIDAILLCQVDDVVEVVPVGVRCHTVPVPMCDWQRVRGLAVDVDGGYGIDDLYLYHVIALLATTLQVPFRLGTVQTLGQQPPRLTLPEERRPVLVH